MTTVSYIKCNMPVTGEFGHSHCKRDAVWQHPTWGNACVVCKPRIIRRAKFENGGTIPVGFTMHGYAVGPFLASDIPQERDCKICQSF